MVNRRQRSLLINASPGRQERAHSRWAVAQKGQVCEFVFVNYLVRDSWLKVFVKKIKNIHDAEKIDNTKQNVWLNVYPASR